MYLGFRVKPQMYLLMDAGVQLAKMTPFRSAVVMMFSALSIAILALLKLKGGVITYVIVSPYTW